MERILGIDTGTNSLGWAIVDKDENGTHWLLKVLIYSLKV